MTFRTRLVLAAAGAAAVAVLLASGGAYVAARNAVVGTVDDTLTSSANASLQSGLVNLDVTLNEVVQIAFPNGQVAVSTPVALPVTGDVRAVAGGQAGSYFTTVVVHGVDLRELVTQLPAGTRVQINGYQSVLAAPSALQLATRLTGVNDQLSGLGLLLGSVALAGVLVAFLLGWLVARRALAPLATLSSSVEEMAETLDVTRRLDPGMPDELGRLRRAFNRLLGALESSRESQRQLVLDAAHELRTPLTSLRTNLEVVRRLEDLPVDDRHVLVADVLTQMEELTHLVTDLAVLARGELPEAEPEPLRLDLVVADLVGLAASHGRARGVTIEADLSESWVVARRDRLSRAVGNLLDNAIKWSPDGGHVAVTSRAGWVTVRDHGPGIAPADLPHVFDRFYRAPSARAMPGSGLGLAIVAQVAASEGGTVTAEAAEGGGALLRFVLPEVPAASPAGLKGT